MMPAIAACRQTKETQRSKHSRTNARSPKELQACRQTLTSSNQRSPPWPPPPPPPPPPLPQLSGRAEELEDNLAALLISDQWRALLQRPSQNNLTIVPAAAQTAQATVAYVTCPRQRIMFVASLCTGLWLPPGITSHVPHKGQDMTGH